MRLKAKSIENLRRDTKTIVNGSFTLERKKRTLQVISKHGNKEAVALCSSQGDGAWAKPVVKDGVGGGGAREWYLAFN